MLANQCMGGSKLTYTHKTRVLTKTVTRKKNKIKHFPTNFYINKSTYNDRTWQTKKTIQHV